MHWSLLGVDALAVTPLDDSALAPGDWRCTWARWRRGPEALWPAGRRTLRFRGDKRAGVIDVVDEVVHPDLGSTRRRVTAAVGEAPVRPLREWSLHLDGLDPWGEPRLRAAGGGQLRGGAIQLWGMPGGPFPGAGPWISDLTLAATLSELSRMSGDAPVRSAALLGLERPVDGLTLAPCGRTTLRDGGALLRGWRWSGPGVGAWHAWLAHGHRMLALCSPDELWILDEALAPPAPPPADPSPPRGDAP